MSDHVCPWWLAYTFDNPLRRLVHRPERVLAPYVRQGMSVMDVGCGMGHFSIGMARMVGPKGSVRSVDVQQKMLDTLMQRAQKAGVAERIHTLLCDADSLGMEEQVDFILAFWMVHESPDQARMLAEFKGLLNAPEGRLLVAEPRMHVSKQSFEAFVKNAESQGLILMERPRVAFSRAAVFSPA
ncbi:MAG: class I SAM-dependent methyltransferase [Thermodesulfovibrionales bacterium]|nr:class I SAM-dependent methyltransferase [Thermodesulfovibrionales bacterium]